MGVKLMVMLFNARVPILWKLSVLTDHPRNAIIATAPCDAPMVEVIIILLVVVALDLRVVDPIDAPLLPAIADSVAVVALRVVL